MLVRNEGLTFRLVLIGDSSVGKTCIVNRLVNNQFHEDEMNTIGAMYETYTAMRNGTEITLQIWDTAGQEKFKSLGPVYYRDAAGAIVVFDLSNRHSFSNISTWLSAFRSSAGDDALVVIVGNKNDLVSDDTTLAAEASDWAQSNGYRFFSTSAKTGQGIEDLFGYVMDALAQNKGEFAMDSVPRFIDANDVESERGCC